MKLPRSRKELLLLAALCGIVAGTAAAAEPPAGDDPWLGRLVGDWVLQGKVAGKDTTHDVEAEWVLNHLYVRLHEVSREKDAKGRPAYLLASSSAGARRGGHIIRLGEIGRANVCTP